MLNNTGFTRQSAVSNTQIFVDPGKVFSVGCVVDDATAVMENGKKLIKAGTPLYGDLDNRADPFVPATTTSGVSNAVGVLVHDVDITDGANNGAVAIWGFVNTKRLDEKVLSMITDEVKAALKAAVTFIAF